MVDAGFIATEKQKALEGIVAFSREQSEVCSAHYPTFGVIAPVYLALRGSRLCERFGRFIHVFSQNVYVQLVVSLSKKKKKVLDLSPSSHACVNGSRYSQPVLALLERPVVVMVPGSTTICPDITTGWADFAWN